MEDKCSLSSIGADWVVGELSSADLMKGKPVSEGPLLYLSITTALPEVLGAAVGWIPVLMTLFSPRHGRQKASRFVIIPSFVLDKLTFLNAW